MLIVSTIDSEQRLEILSRAKQAGLVSNLQASNKTIARIVERLTDKTIFPERAIYYLDQLLMSPRFYEKKKTKSTVTFFDRTKQQFNYTCLSCQKKLDSSKLKVIKIFNLEIVKELKVPNHQVICRKCFYKNSFTNIDLRFLPENWKNYNQKLKNILKPLESRSEYWSNN